MPREIERKFLLRDDSWRLQVIATEHLTQGYLNETKQPNKCSVRVRCEDEQCFLNVKSIEKGVSRDEFEYKIPENDARYFLQNLCCSNIITKMRHKIEYLGQHWVIDEFLADNKPLVIAEIELNSEDEFFEKPKWLAEEVTFDSKYYNSNLAKKPFSLWH